LKFWMLWIVATLTAQEGPALFAPADRSIVAEGNIRVAGRAAGKAELLLDGKILAFASPAPGVVMAQVMALPGLHELVLKGDGGSTKATFFVGKEHDGWKVFRPHPPGALGCDSCHAVKNETWSLKRASQSLVCHSCHDKEKFAGVHTHNTDTLADCQICHLPHGSTAKSHMKTSKEIACKQCHS
jgi:predicted CXXCH cytochrome family protein